MIRRITVRTTKSPLAGFLAAWLFTLGVTGGLAASVQDEKHDAALRTVHGAVLDRDENPVPSSVVYLRNIKSQVVKTYIADETGRYRFSGLDPNTDYQIHAEHGDFASALRTVSAFDSRKDVEVILKLTRRKR